MSRIAADHTVHVRDRAGARTFAIAGGAGEHRRHCRRRVCVDRGEGDAWITLGGTTGGIGDGTVTYAIAPYTGEPKVRTGTLVVAGNTFTITQNRLRLLVRGGGA